MGCEGYRDALSAQADGEDPGIDQRLLDHHLAQCPSCRAFADTVVDGRRRGRVTSAPRMPDLSRQVARRHAAQDRDRVGLFLRALLALVAVELLVLSVADLTAGGGDDEAVHATRHLGAFVAAYAVGLLAVVVRPARARAILAVAVVVAGALAVTAVVDIVQGRVPLGGEALHVPEIVSVVVIWLLARPGPTRTPRAHGGPTAVAEEPNS